ncbi:MAG TPA: SCO family protein [Gemmatimonadaceae bacterium]|nr:SCO family protein [Gemmatimonadaceae bacterium]
MRRLATTLALATLLAGCARPAPAPTSGASASAADRFSVYDLGSSWRDQRDSSRSLASPAGTPRVVAMVYTHCTATCPLSIAEMKRIERATGPDVGLVLVSLDPERDTPGRLAEFAAETGLDTGRWTLLSGSDDDTRALAAALGVRYRRLSAAELAHSNAITLLDAGGEVVEQELGLAGGEDMLRAIRALTTAGASTNPQENDR